MKKKHRNQFISRLLAMCLAVVMMLSMGITASATPITSKGSFDVIGFDTNPDLTVTAYQIITVNIDDAAEQPEYPMYTWAGPVAEWLGNNDTYEEYIDADLGTNAVADVFKNAQAVEMTKFLEELAAAIKTDTANAFASLVKKDASVSNGTASFPDMAMGEYLIVASGGVKIYQPTTVKLVPEYDKKSDKWEIGEAVVGEETDGSTAVKSSEPQIKKSVFMINDAALADHTVAVGDTVTFKLEADVPDYPEGATNKTFIISDTVGTGLKYQSNSVKVYNDESCQTKIDSTLYKVTETNATVPDQSGKPRTFKIEFKNTFFESSPVPPKVYVTYEAKVTADAFIGTTGGKLINDAFLGYSNNPYDANSYTERNDEETVYTYAINLTKVDTDGDKITNNTATFELKSGENTLYFTGSDGVYTYDSSNNENTSGATKDLTTSSSKGTLTLQGLDAGTYTLTETKAPDGYVLPNGSITIKITDADAENGGPNGTIDKDQDGNVVASGGAEIYVAEGAQGDGVTINDTTISFEVVNKNADQGAFTLPVTGGAGTLIFTMAGILLMGGAVALLVVVLRRKRS